MHAGYLNRAPPLPFAGHIRFVDIEVRVGLLSRPRSIKNLIGGQKDDLSALRNHRVRQRQRPINIDGPGRVRLPPTFIQRGDARDRKTVATDSGWGAQAAMSSDKSRNNPLPSGRRVVRKTRRPLPPDDRPGSDQSDHPLRPRGFAGVWRFHHFAIRGRQHNAIK